LASGPILNAYNSAAISRLLPSEVNARLLSLAVNVGLLTLAVNVRLLSSKVNVRLLANVFLLIYVRGLLLNEAFVITVDTSVTGTMELLLLPMQRSIRSVSMEASLLDSKHVTLLTSKGCSSPNSLMVLSLFHFRDVLLATSAFDLASIASTPFFSGARPEHLHDLAVVSHSLFRFIPAHSFLLSPVPPIQAVLLFPFWRGSTPPQCPINGLVLRRALIP
jgi:hypothetical protein